MSELKVKLLEYTPNPEKLVAISAKLCYSPVSIDELEKNLTKENTDKFINMLMDLGHESVLEHITFTFAIEGVSRITEQQLTRHRIGVAYSIQSGRYVKRGNPDFVIPPEIEKDASLTNIFLEQIESAKKAYNLLVLELMDRGKTEKQAIEDARYIYPQALGTKIIVTMNLRELLHFFNKRCCMRSQWEIRALAKMMLKECRKVSQLLFHHAGAICMKNHKCPEGKMSCGLFPTE
jgi:thymidylate synthase (FAD)